MTTNIPYSTLPPGVSVAGIEPPPERCPVCDTVRPENEPTCPQCGYEYDDLP